MNGAIFSVAARRLGAADGTPATFHFNCNHVPHVSGLTVEDAPGSAKIFRWHGTDLEDGLTGEVEMKLDDLLTNNVEGTAGVPLQSVTIPEATFRGSLRQSAQGHRAGPRPGGRDLGGDPQRDVRHRGASVAGPADPQQRLRERPLAVHPLRSRRTRRLRQLGDIAPLELVRALRPDALAFVERHGDLEPGNGDLVRAAGDECISIRRSAWRQRASWRKRFRSKPAESSRFMRASRFRLKAAVTPSGSS